MKKQIHELWCYVLGLDDIDDNDRFYDIGGNSITLLIIIDEVKNKFDIELPTTDTYEYDSVEKMTEYISRILVS